MAPRFPASRPAPRLRILLLLLVVLLLTLAGWPVATATAAAPARPVASPAAANPAFLYDGVLPAQRASVVAATAGRLSRYTIAATLHESYPAVPNSITGTEALQFVNETGHPLPDLYFRLYANAPEYAEGGIAVHDLTVDGVAAPTALSVEDTVLRVRLPVPIPVDGTAELRLGFTTTVPTAPARSYGMFAYHPATGTWALAHWYPILAGYDPVSGWVLSDWASWGDPIFSTTSLYDVSVTAPAGLTLVATGTVEATTAEGSVVVRRYVSGPVRDFTLVADNDFQSVSRTVDGVLVTSSFNPNHAAAGAAVLASAAQALAVYDRLFGQYPYKSLELVEIPLQNGAAGVEFPQLVFIGAGAYGQNPAPGTIPRELDFTVAHEVAHQWWYGLVGNDQYQHAFLDESLAQYSTVIYISEQYGTARAKLALDANCTYPYLQRLFTAGDGVVDYPTNDFSGDSAYVAIVYAKGPLGFAALRRAIGDDAFFRGLRDYLARERFQVATPADLRESFERASGRDLAALWHHWFDAADGTQDFTPKDLANVMVELGK